MKVFIKATCLFLGIRATLASHTQQPLAEDISGLDQIISASPLLAFHRDIVEIPSVSNNEKNIGEFLLDFLSAHNLSVEKQIVAPDRFNVYAYTGNNRFPEILLTSHIDTVPPFIPYSLHLPSGASTREDIRIAGRGTVDAKASVAAIVLAILETLHDSPNASLGLLLDVGEENTGVGMKHFSRSELNASPPTFHTVIFGEPTDLSLVAGHKGSLSFRLVSQGKAAHSGYPWLGESAITSLIPVLDRLDTLQRIPPENGGLPQSDILGNSTLNIGRFQGGVAANVVPAYAEATISVRLAAGTPDGARGIIQAAVDDVLSTNKHGNANVSLDFGDRTSGAPPQRFDVDVFGFEIITVNYGTDAFSLQIHDQGGAKVRRYLYGPGKFHLAHGEHEAITVGELEDGVRGYKRLISAALART